MNRMYLIILLIMLTMILVLSVFTYSQYAENKDLTNKNRILSELYNAEKGNVETLNETIKNQNALIEKFKEESITFEKKVEDLNSEIERLNSEPPVYVYMEKPKEEKEVSGQPEEKIEKSETTPDEAMKWLLDKSSSLSQ